MVGPRAHGRAGVRTLTRWFGAAVSTPGLRPAASIGEVRRVKLLPRVAGITALLFTTALQAETWQTTNGPVEGTLSGVYGPVVALTQNRAVSLVPMNHLDDTELGRVADYVAQHPAARTRWKDSKSRLARALIGHLDVLKDGRLVRYDPGDRLEPEFYVIYFGAGWCPPCREFSHRFVPMYRQLQQAAPGRFEVVFLSSDRSTEDMLKYVKEVGMPWPVLAPEMRHRVPAVEGWEADSIPCVAVLTPDGDALYHSHHGKEYLGPDKPIEQLQELLAVTVPGNPVARKIEHRFAVLQRVRTAGERRLNPQPYLVSLDLKKYQTLEAKMLQATLRIDAAGHVTDAAFAPKQEAAIDYDLVHDAGQWLFLPEVRDGKPVASKVVLPLQLRK